MARWSPGLGRSAENPTQLQPVKMCRRSHTNTAGSTYDALGSIRDLPKSRSDSASWSWSTGAGVTASLNTRSAYERERSTSIARKRSSLPREHVDAAAGRVVAGRPAVGEIADRDREQRREEQQAGERIDRR